jgi:hypothetical protein
MVTVKVNTTAFDKAMQEYMKYSSRSLVEAVNQHAYYAARNATQTTHAADATKIKQDLEAMSKSYPNVPLAAILINIDLKKKGKKGLYGEKMRQAVEKFIRVRVAHRNFLRSGWIPAIKLLANIVPKRGGNKIPVGTDKKGRNFGGAKPAQYSNSITNWNAIASVWNSAVGKKADSKSIAYLEEGAQMAIDQEVESMRKYIERKQEEASHKFFG